MIYKIRQYFLYGHDFEYEIDLEDLKFCKSHFSEWQKQDSENFWCVIEPNTGYDNLLIRLQPINGISIYYLPLNYAIICFNNIKFIGDNYPKIISKEEMNLKLKPIIDNIVYIELKSSSMKLLSAYRLVEIDGEYHCIINSIDYRNISEDILRFNSIIFSIEKMGMLEKNQISLNDNRIITHLNGEGANTLWSSLLKKSLKNIAYQSKLVDPDFNFDKWHDYMCKIKQQ